MGMSSPQKNTVRFALIGLTLLAVGSLLVQELEDEAAPCQSHQKLKNPLCQVL